ncbi:MAG TPA: thioredoxin-disulfide reductase, partial [Spirochaetia bacterium]|nr:thioredoxin-disulfide reductase [Spirochaetia bacterium]
MSDRIQEITQDQFEQEVLTAPRAVVDFFSTECPPCDAFAVKYHRAARLFGEDIAFYTIFRQGNRELAEKLGVRSSPTVVFFENGVQKKTRLGGAVKNADLNRELSALLPDGRGQALLAGREREETDTDVLILGGGPAGLTAGLYLAQARLRVLIADPALPGGYVSVTHEVSNYPGFTTPQKGFMLAHNFYEQARVAGVEFRGAAEITAVDLKRKTVLLDDIETVRARFLVLATGSAPRPLGIPGEAEYRGNGISYCATCDAKYYEGKEVVVIGGGNSALEESLFIAGFASQVTIVHQFKEFTARRQAVEEVTAHPKIKTLLG